MPKWSRLSGFNLEREAIAHKLNLQQPRPQLLCLSRRGLIKSRLKARLDSLRHRSYIAAVRGRRQRVFRHPNV